MFETLLGNDEIKGYLKRMVERGTIGNSLLFSGPEGVGKSLFATALAKELFSLNDPSGCHAHKVKTGNHPDIQHLRPEGKAALHTIESMRRFSEDVYLHPYEADWKVYIIHEAHRMITYSANALLKTFEEPARRSAIILLTHAPELLLPTVLSRCRTLHFRRVEEREIARFLVERERCPTDEARRYAAMASGSIGAALQLMQKKGDAARERLLQFLSSGGVATYLQLTDFIKEIVQEVDLSKKEVEREVFEEIAHGVPVGEMSALQRQGVDKEVAGAVSMRQLQGANALFETIFSWYRDLHLLYLGGDNRLVINKEFEPAMQEIVLDKEPPPLEEVERHIRVALTSLARSTSLALTLENLFLKLNIL